MSSMSSHETGAPVEPQDRYSGSHRVDNGDEYGDEQAVIADEDVVVIDSYDAADDGDPDTPEHRDPQPRTIWSAGAPRPAEATPEEPIAGAAAEAVGPEATDPKTPIDESAASNGTANDSPALGNSVPETVVPATGAPGAGAGQWSEIKAMFVDDPGESVKRASGMVERAMENLMSTVRERHESLASWQANDASGTEELRNALRGYQNLFDQLDGMSDRFRAGADRVGSA
jgi:hypothetical protein